MKGGRRHDFDAVIVGGGMVGLCAAALLAADERLSCWRVAVVEPVTPRPPRDDAVDLRVSALSRASQRILEAAQAWPAINERACPYSDMVVWDAASSHDARDALRFTAALVSTSLQSSVVSRGAFLIQAAFMALNNLLFLSTWFILFARFDKVGDFALPDMLLLFGVGAQALYGIKPDLTVLGKIIGGGLPVGAYGGRREIMDLIAPSGPVYQAGTLSGNPLAVTAGLATLKQLKTRGIYKKLEEKSAALAKGIGEAAQKTGIPVTQTRVGSMLTTFFTSGPVVDWNTAKQSDTKRYGQFFHQMLEQGVYFAPSQFEAAFLSTAHTSADIEKTIRAAHAAFKKL